MRRGFCKLYMFNVQPVSPSASNWDVLVRQGVMSKGCCWKDGWYVSYVSGSVKKKWDSSSRRGFCKFCIFKVQPVTPSTSNKGGLVCQGVDMRVGESMGWCPGREGVIGCVSYESLQSAP